MARLSLRPGGPLARGEDAAYSPGISRPLQRGRRRAYGPGDDRLAPDREGFERSRAIRAGIAPSAAGRDGEAPRHPVQDRGGPLPEGRSTVHVRFEPVLVPASLDTAGRAALPG